MLYIIIMELVKIDFEKNRKNRQTTNDTIIYDSIKSNNILLFNENINQRALERILAKFKLNSVDQLIKKCNDNNDLCIAISMLISKNSSRQSTKDEIKQINICNTIGEKYNIKIENLNVNELRPTKNGEIINQKEMKKNNIKKDDCLKSFDAKISGNISGYITAKVVYGNGGHQDNVFEEIDTIADWWKQYKNLSEEKLVVLIDTNLTSKFLRLKVKYSDVDNILFTNHYDFQLYMIENYTKSLSSI